jgi:hypothetical protein
MVHTEIGMTKAIVGVDAVLRPWRDFSFVQISKLYVLEVYHSNYRVDYLVISIFTQNSREIADLRSI